MQIARVAPYKNSKNTNNKMVTQRKYGDENTGYSVLAIDISPEDAKKYLESNNNDDITMHMNPRRTSALIERAKE